MIAAAVEARLSRLSWVEAEERATERRLLLEEQEDRGRRQNLRIRGMPEVDGPENLFDILQGLFRLLLNMGDEVTGPIKLDRANRVMHPRTLDMSILRDIVCKIHHFQVKDLLSQKAWDHGPYEYRAGSITVLPDLSRATLQCRTLIWPLLENFKQALIPYRWGFPFHLIVRKGEER